MPAELEIIVKNGFAELKGTKVYLCNAETPWGVLSDLLIDKNSGKVLAYLIKTLSLVPVSRIVRIKDAKLTENKKLEINKTSLIQSCEKFVNENNSNTVRCEKIKNIVLSNGISGKIKNMHFDMETGEISNAVILKNIIAGNHTVSINKISVKDNTIYAENFIEEE